MEVQARDVHNNVMTDALGNNIMQTVYIVHDKDLKERLMDAYQRESNYGYKEQEKYKDGVISMVKFLKGQIKESV